MPDQAEAVKRQILGKCVEIIDKPDTDWVRFNIDVGTQYPIGLSTKLPKLIEEARAVGGDTATWSFTESQGKPNPNRPGTFYMNRYLDKVEEGEHVTAGGNASAPAAVPASGARDQAIIRQTCLKAAASLYGGLGQPVDLDMVVADELPIRSDPVLLALLRAAEQMENWVHRDDGSALPF